MRISSEAIRDPVVGLNVRSAGIKVTQDHDVARF